MRYMQGLGAFMFLIDLVVAGTNALLVMNPLCRQVDDGPRPRLHLGGDENDSRSGRIGAV